MPCPHPVEERLRVYEGTATPRSDRLLCGLCGELLYEAPLPLLNRETAPAPQAPGRHR